MSVASNKRRAKRRRASRRFWEVAFSRGGYIVAHPDTMIGLRRYAARLPWVRVELVESALVPRGQLFAVAGAVPAPRFSPFPPFDTFVGLDVSPRLQWRVPYGGVR